MSSQAQRMRKRLLAEQAKPFPDQDIVYALQQQSPYWNTIDTDRVKRGLDKLNGLGGSDDTTI